MLSSASSKDTINAFTNCVKNTPRHLFRKRFLNMTSSAEAFLAVRQCSSAKRENVNLLRYHEKFTCITNLTCTLEH